MSWGSDITSYNTAVNALGAYIIAREGNTPSQSMFNLRKDAQAALTTIATPLSATVVLPKHHPSA